MADMFVYTYIICICTVHLLVVWQLVHFSHSYPFQYIVQLLPVVSIIRMYATLNGRTYIQQIYA